MANFCRKCGHKLLKDDNYCPNCGNKIINNAEKNEQGTNYITASSIKINEDNKNNTKFIKNLYQIPREYKLGLTKLVIYIVYPLTIILTIFDLINYFFIYIHFIFLLIAIIACLLALSLSIYKYHTLAKNAFKFAIIYYILFFSSKLILTYLYSDYGYELLFGGEFIHLLIIVIQNNKFKSACFIKNTYYDYQQRLTEIAKDFNPEQKDNNN